MKNTYIQILYLGIVIVLISVSFLTYRSLNNYMHEVAAIRHSNHVIIAVQDVIASVRDAETAHRGFQLTRDTVYLDTYYNSLKVVPAQMKSLDSLLTFSTHQERRADTLRLMIQNQFSIISQILTNAKRSSLYMDQYESSLLLRGKQNMDQIRQVVTRIIDAEQVNFRSRVTKEDNYKAATPFVLLVYSLVALTGMTFLFIRILDALNNRRVAEEQLKITVEDLKKEMAIRTAQQLMIEERGMLLKEAESLAHMGSWRWYEKTQQLLWSDGIYLIWDQNPAGFQPSWDAFISKVYEEDKPLMRDFLETIRHRQVTAQLNFRLELNGSIKHVLMSTAPRKSEGSTLDILGTVVDVTEQKISESQLRQFTAELQRSNQDLEQFAYVASHDLQEPLRKIRAFGDRLLSKYQKILEGQGSDYIHRMQQAAERMQNLIEDLLSFSRLSRTGVYFDRLDVNELMKEVLDDLDTIIKRERGKVIVEELPSFRGEGIQIKRLFQNLISNAIKFHKPDQGSEVIVSGRVTTGSELENELKISFPRPEYVRIRVKDTGIGFDEKYAEKIFNIFQRLHGRQEFQGTGIGLAICRKIVTNHDGFIIAKSEEGVGSEFIVILPRE